MAQHLYTAVCLSVCLNCMFMFPFAAAYEVLTDPKKAHTIWETSGKRTNLTSRRTSGAKTQPKQHCPYGLSLRPVSWLSNWGKQPCPTAVGVGPWRLTHVTLSSASSPAFAYCNCCAVLCAANLQSNRRLAPSFLQPLAPCSLVSTTKQCGHAVSTVIIACRIWTQN